MKLTDINLKQVYNKSKPDTKKQFDEIKGKDFFLPDIRDEIKGLKDIYRILGIKEEDILIYLKPKSSFEKYINACAIIPRIVEVYNQGTILNWDNANEIKYLPYFKKVGSCWVFCCYLDWSLYAVGSAGHHYKNSVLANDACNKFESIYNDFYTG